MARRIEIAPQALEVRLRRSLISSPFLIAALALLLGAIVGGAAAFGPVVAIAGLLALGAGYAMLTSTRLGLAAVIAIATLLPFGTLPFRAIITPNFLTLALVALMGVWILRILARSDMYDLRLTPLGLPLIGFVGFTFFSLVLGARGLPDTTTLHNYAKFVCGVLLYFSVANVIRSRAEMRFALRVLLLSGGAAALLGLLLYALPDQVALNLLVALGRIGYPTSGRVLRYVEDDPNGLERAIGTSVDPNSFGGMLALIGAISAAQLFTNRAVLPRPLLLGICGAVGLALLLTFSRAALFGLIIAVGYLATVRYRRLWWAMLLAGLLAAMLMLGLGIAGDFVTRVSSGVRFEDQAQQMRLAEYRNAIAIIQRYPVFGIGFGAAPDLDLTAGVSSIYLAIGQRLGLVGLAIFLVIISAWFLRSLRHMGALDEEGASWLLGTQAGAVAALAVGLADHYFFNIEFSHMGALFWGCVGLGAAVELLDEEDDAPAGYPDNSLAT
jgi:polysaccharide biosynthesis protein PslJ